MLALAVSAANLTAYANDAQAAYTQAHQTLQQLTGTSATTFSAFAHSGTTTTDRFADYTTNKAAFLRHMTFGFGAIDRRTRRRSCRRARRSCCRRASRT